MALAESGRLVAHALAQAQAVIEADTQVSTVDLRLLENLNTNQFLNYIKLEKDLDALELDSRQMALLKTEVDELKADLAHIEKQTAELVAVTAELRAWLKEAAGT